MKKQNLKILFSLLILTILSNTMANSSYITDENEAPRVRVTDYLVTAEKQFDALPDDKARQDFLAASHLVQAATSTPSDETYIDKAPKHVEMIESNLLAITVSAGDVALARKFLGVVKDVNDSMWNSQGYRQEYTLSHVVLDPLRPHTNVSHWSNLAMIDLLAAHGIDFNNMPPVAGDYHNPALFAGCLHGYNNYTAVDGDYNAAELRQARALVYGADPTIDGTSQTALANTTKASKIYERAFDDFLSLRQHAVMSQHLKLHAVVEEAFKGIRERRLRELQSIEF